MLQLQCTLWIEDLTVLGTLTVTVNEKTRLFFFTVLYRTKIKMYSQSNNLLLTEEIAINSCSPGSQLPKSHVKWFKKKLLQE